MVCTCDHVCIHPLGFDPKKGGPFSYSLFSFFSRESWWVFRIQFLCNVFVLRLVFYLINVDNVNTYVILYNSIIYNVRALIDDNEVLGCNNMKV